MNSRVRSFIHTSIHTYGTWGIWLLLFSLIGLLAGCGQPSYTFHATPVDPPRLMAEMPGTNWDNSAFHLSALKGKVVVLFFGYTNCPDVCSLALADLTALYRQLGERANEIAVVFVSTDPQRDTTERLAAYVQAFNEKFYGVHIAEADLPAVKKFYGIYSEVNQEQHGPTAQDYFVDHSGYFYVLDKAGQWRLFTAFDTPIADLQADVEQLLRE